MVVEVTCAIIEREDGCVLAVQRSASMSLPCMWEFPGGKMEPGETYHECLQREIIEELNVEIHIHDAIDGSEQPYPERIIKLIPFICTIKSGEIHLTEHMDARWLSPAELTSVNWAPADIKIAENYLKFIEEKVR